MLFRMQHVISVFLCLAMAGPSFAELTVRQDGSGDYTTIGAALAAAAAGEVVRVTDQGEYNESLDLIDVSLISDPAGAIITGDPSALAGRNELVVLSGNQPVLLEGFTVSSQLHGVIVMGSSSSIMATVRSCDISAPWAGVQFFNNAADTAGELTIDACNIHNCDYCVDAQGGGSALGTMNIINGTTVSSSWNGSLRFLVPMDLTLSDSEIGSSGAGYGFYYEGGLAEVPVTVNVSNTKFANNAKSGVQLVGPAGAFTFTGCEFTDNAEWGLNSWLISDDYVRSITMTDSVFNNNGNECVAINGGNTDTSKLQYDIERCQLHCTSGAAGAVLLNVSDGAFINNLVDHGANTLVSFNEGTKTFYFNTFVSTADSDALRGIQITGSATVDAKNNIFAGVGLGIANDSGTATLTNDHNLFDTRVVTPINNGSVGEGSLLGVDPAFIEASTGVGTGDFSLADGSPALGVGVDVTGVTVDILGNQRPNPAGSLPDLGAYESLMTPTEVSSFELY